MDFGLTGKTAIVTGASGGIGSAIALELAKEGVNLSLGYYSHECNELVEQIEVSGGNAIAVQSDVSQAKGVNKLIRATYNKFRKIDILVNSAGAYLNGLVEDTKEEDWDRLMAINLKSVFLLSRAVMKYMKKQKWGRIINLGSAIGKSANNYRPWLDSEYSSKGAAAAYAASKAGVHAITNNLAKELAAYNITVNCIAPGPVKTSMLPTIPKLLKDQIPLGRMGSPEEISAFVVLLASEKAGFMTGETIDINGGLWMD